MHALFVLTLMLTCLLCLLYSTEVVNGTSSVWLMLRDVAGNDSDATHLHTDYIKITQTMEGIVFLILGMRQYAVHLSNVHM